MPSRLAFDLPPAAGGRICCACPPLASAAAVLCEPFRLTGSSVVLPQATAPPLIHGANIQPTTAAEFEAIVASVKLAVAQGVQPVRIAKGSSGSYFARNEGKVCVAVFKPKDEEPYGRLNPKVWQRLSLGRGLAAEKLMATAT